jgi:hypothetical protein
MYKETTGLYRLTYISLTTRSFGTGSLSVIRQKEILDQSQSLKHRRLITQFNQEMNKAWLNCYSVITHHRLKDYINLNNSRNSDLVSGGKRCFNTEL